MQMGYLQISVPIIALLINSFTQISFYKFLPSLGLLKSEYIGFVLGFCFILAVELWIFFLGINALSNIIAVSVANLIIYFCMSFLYFTYINLGETARRIRLLRELSDAKDGLSIKEILSRYNAREIIERRINRLEGNGQIICREGSYFVGGNLLLLIAKTIVLAKLIVLGKKSEFD